MASAGVQGYVGRGVAQEVVVAQLRPELLHVILIVAVAHQRIQRSTLGLADLLFAVYRVFGSRDARRAWFRCRAGAAGWRARSSSVRVGGVNVGHGQYVQVVEMGLIAHDLGKVMDDLRIGQVLALGIGRHDQVVLHQPDNQAGIPLRQLVANTERFGIHGANF